jgi:hypothetical protein
LRAGRKAAVLPNIACNAPPSLAEAIRERNPGLQLANEEERVDGDEVDVKAVGPTGSPTQDAEHQPMAGNTAPARVARARSQRVRLAKRLEIIQWWKRDLIEQKQNGDLKALKPEKKMPLHFSRPLKGAGVGGHVFVAAAREVDDDEIVFGQAR